MTFLCLFYKKWLKIIKRYKKIKKVANLLIFFKKSVDISFKVWYINNAIAKFGVANSTIYLNIYLGKERIFVLFNSKFMTTIIENICHANELRLNIRV